MEDAPAMKQQPPLESLPNELLENILLCAMQVKGFETRGITSLARVCSRFRCMVEHIVYRSITHSTYLPLTPQRLLLLGRTLAENRELASLVTCVDFRGLDKLNHGPRRWRDDPCKYPWTRIPETANALMHLQADEHNGHRRVTRASIITRLNQGNGGSAMSLVLALAPNLHSAYLPSHFDWLAALHFFIDPTVYPKLKLLTWDSGDSNVRQGLFLLNFLISAPNLEYLALKRVSLNCLSLTNAGPKFTPSLARLTELRLEDCRLQLDAIRNLLMTCTALECFVLTQSHNRLPKALDFLTPVSHTLRRLSLMCTADTSHAPSGRVMEPLATTTASPAAEIISRFPNLRRLTISQCYVQACGGELGTRHQWLANFVDAAIHAEHRELELLQVTRLYALTEEHLHYLADTLARQHSFSPLRQVHLTLLPDRAPRTEQLQQSYQDCTAATQVRVVIKPKFEGYFPELIQD